MGSDASKEIDKTPANIFKILCDGYIRRIEQDLNSKLMPSSIYYICYKFYHYCNYLIYLSQDYKLNPNRIYITDLDTDNSSNDTKNNSIKCEIIPFKPGNASTNKKDLMWDIVNAGIHYQKRLPLPQIISESKSNINTHSINDCDVIFKCGGRISSSQTPNSTVMALIFDTFDKSKVYHWTLPSLHNPICGNFVLYSHKYGLLSIGGETHNPNNGTSAITKNISNLLFAEMGTKTEWQWSDNRLMPLTHAIYQPCVTMINDSNIVCVGGKYGTAQKSAQIYNIESNECKALKDINNARYGAGMYFDECRDIIYLCGGFTFGNALKSVEFYDLNKSTKWNQSLPDTNMRHDYYPIIWTDLNHSLLYIASVNSNSIESIDIRVNNLKHWTVVYGDSEQSKLQDLFGTAFVTQNIQTCRLLK